MTNAECRMERESSLRPAPGLFMATRAGDQVGADLRNAEREAAQNQERSEQENRNGNGGSQFKPERKRNQFSPEAGEALRAVAFAERLLDKLSNRLFT
jgi:hypothetical protein